MYLCLLSKSFPLAAHTLIRVSLCALPSLHHHTLAHTSGLACPPRETSSLSSLSTSTPAGIQTPARQQTRATASWYLAHRGGGHLSNCAAAWRTSSSTTLLLPSSSLLHQPGCVRALRAQSACARALRATQEGHHAIIPEGRRTRVNREGDEAEVALWDIPGQ